MKIKDFFNNVSDFYDGMTDSSQSISKRKELIRKFLTPGIKTAVDLGCGTGNDSISMGLNGLDVTGFDISEKMIRKARNKSQTYNFNYKFHTYSIDKIPKKFDNRFDIALSLGNSISLIEDTKISKSIERISEILKNNGILIVQILNYALIERTGTRIINIKHDISNTYIRFYDTFSLPLNFNILRLSRENPKDFELHTTKLFPYDKNYIAEVLIQAGFKKIDFFSSLKKEKFDKNKSKDLILVAYK